MQTFTDKERLDWMLANKIESIEFNPRKIGTEEENSSHWLVLWVGGSEGFKSITGRNYYECIDKAIVFQKTKKEATDEMYECVFKFKFSKNETYFTFKVSHEAIDEVGLRHAYKKACEKTGLSFSAEGGLFTTVDYLSKEEKEALEENGVSNAGNLKAEIVDGKEVYKLADKRDFGLLFLEFIWVNSDIYGYPFEVPERLLEHFPGMNEDDIGFRIQLGMGL